MSCMTWDELQSSETLSLFTFSFPVEEFSFHFCLVSLSTPLFPPAWQTWQSPVNNHYTDTHTLWVWGEPPFRHASVGTVCVCLWVLFFSVCVRLSDTSVTSALQLHHHQHHECLHGILWSQSLTGCMTVGTVVLAPSVHVRHQRNTYSPSGLKRSHLDTATCDWSVFEIWFGFMWCDSHIVLMKINNGEWPESPASVLKSSGNL